MTTVVEKLGIRIERNPPECSEVLRKRITKKTEDVRRGCESKKKAKEKGEKKMKRKGERKYEEKKVFGRKCP